ncbi:Uncharacterised protein [Sphingobacterium spiritivorum]|uniref:Immunity protein 43 domain-containing protein n=1 Tax=Sphingobacterium spiritivorum TaxID=258 RepID=A0A380B9U7_SPHSI|nr:Imm43 family immunity protein [Sphingobacterium spiritivorum]SUI96922.1 Uncharacterised protein [Sphingobacterium spiritivorum]
MENKLFISFQRGYIKRKGTPLTDDVVLFDSFDATKKAKFFSVSEWRTLDYREIPFPPVEDKYKFPSNLFLLIKKKLKNIDFHYLEYGSDVKILSQRFFDFLIKNGLNKEQFEFSDLQLVDKDGNIVTDGKFVALRFGLFDDHLFDFSKQTSVRTKINGNTNYLYPNLRLQGTDVRTVFVIKDFAYRSSLIFSGQSVLTEILKSFEGIDIYSVADYPFIYANQYEEDALKCKQLSLHAER